MHDIVFADVNECTLGTSTCSQTCTNTDGSFECSCGAGYILEADDIGCDGKKQQNLAL